MVSKFTPMARYKRLLQSACLLCGRFLCVMSRKGSYTGTIECDYCGGLNIFKDSNHPIQPEVTA